MASAIDWPKFNSNDPMDSVVKLSHFYGSDPGIVLAGGGNTSVKVGDKIFVKSSGHSLATISADGFVEMDRSRLMKILELEPPKDFGPREAEFKTMTMRCRTYPELAQRPSVECLLHALVPGTFVVHSHARLANMLSCCTNGEKIAAELFGDDVLWIPYAPGWMLASLMRKGLVDYAKHTGRNMPEGIIMANHGLTISGETPDEIRKKTDYLLNTINKYIEGINPLVSFGKVSPVTASRAEKLIDTIAPILRAGLADSDTLGIVTFDDSSLAQSLACASDGKKVALAGALIPDQVVYCKSLPMWFDPGDLKVEELIEPLQDVIKKYRADLGFAPLVVIVRGLGIFTSGADYVSALSTRDIYRDAIEVMSRAVKLGGVSYLTRTESSELENWELENYRRQIAANAKLGRANGKVTIVTGAAQGFGSEIAQDLASQGAYVAITDINEQGAVEAAEKLCETFGPDRAIGLGMDVTDGASIRDALHQVVCKYGGLDVFISNAGVLKAESVKTQPEKHFDFVTAVNYKGYFLCVQKVAPILAMQHLACADYTSDIIQINSKSGLVGSNRNAAYAGSKFGGIGLTQSFALELIEDGIKVNSVCPGNFFDGPLWSDPETGLFVQYLRTGKIPGAKTIEDVRKGYEAKVPLGRGCTTSDVMKAVYYLIEQQYETGQAIPVTGGQVMLS